MAKKKDKEKETATAIQPEANPTAETQVAEGFAEVTEQNQQGSNSDVEQPEDTGLDTKGETATTGEQGAYKEESVVKTKTVKQLEKLLGCSLKSIVAGRLYVTADKMGFVNLEDAQAHVRALDSDKIEVYSIK